MAKKIVILSFCVAIAFILAASFLSTTVDAQGETSEAVDSGAFIDLKHLALLIVESVIFSIVGMIVLVIGYKIFDAVTPYDLNHEIAEDDNAAAGISIAGLLIALGLIVAAAISG
ncbi:MAG: DUF350 domain-containing protein [Candidatus Poribacteria bacterium]|nr:DUF350 domain-containing protein [Candidatus Poribacteria bacterium]